MANDYSGLIGSEVTVVDRWREARLGSYDIEWWRDHGPAPVVGIVERRDAYGNEVVCALVGTDDGVKTTPVKYLRVLAPMAERDSVE